MHNKHLSMIVIGLLFIIATACNGPTLTTAQPVKQTATKEPTPPVMEVAKATTFKATHVINQDSPYYGTGPQQGRPPDGAMKKGTKVITGGKIGNYILVTTVDRVSGYVAETAVQPLAP